MPADTTPPRPSSADHYADCDATAPDFLRLRPDPHELPSLLAEERSDWR